MLRQRKTEIQKTHFTAETQQTRCPELQLPSRTRGRIRTEGEQRQLRGRHKNEPHGLQHKENITDGHVAEQLKHEDTLKASRRPSIQLTTRLTTTKHYESNSPDDDSALIALLMNILS